MNETHVRLETSQSGQEIRVFTEYMGKITTVDYDDLRTCKKLSWCSVPVLPGCTEHPGPCDTSGLRENE